MFPLPFLQAWSQPGIKLFKSSRRASQLNRARRLRNPQGSGPRCTTPSPAPSPLPGGKSPNIRAGDTPRTSSAVRSPSLSHKTTHPAPAGQRGLPGACWNKEPGSQGCTWPGGRSILVSPLARQRVAENPVTRLVRLEQESLPPYGVCLEVVWAEGSPKRGAGWVQGEHRTATRDLLLQEERQRPRGAAGWFSPALQLSRCSGWSGSSSTFPSTDSRAARAVPVTCSARRGPRHRQSL